MTQTALASGRQTGGGGGRSVAPAYAALAAIVLAMSLIRPGDAPFFRDEPTLVKFALGFNQRPADFLGIHFSFTIATNGLYGERKIYYGPFAVWVTQLMLLVSHDPVVLTAMRAAIVGTSMSVALAWLARSMGVSSWLAVVTMLAPWLWYYTRQLWDNSLCLPLSAMAFASYADFIRRGRGWTLSVAVVCAAGSAMIHLMSMALIIPLALHACVFQWRTLWRRKWHLGIPLLVLLALGWQYVRYMLLYAHALPVQELSPVRGWFAPLLGAHHLAAMDLASILGPQWPQSDPAVLQGAVVAGQVVSLLAYPAVWMGMILSIAPAWRALSRRGSEQGMDVQTALDHLALISLGIVVVQCVIDGVQRAYGQAHYFNSTWMAFVFFAWSAVKAMHRRYWNSRALVRLVVPLYGAGLATVVLGAGYKIAVDAGCRNPIYGTCLSEQIRATRELNQYPVTINRRLVVYPWSMVPYLPGVINQLYNLKAATTTALPATRGSMVVAHYRDFSGPDAHIAIDFFESDPEQNVDPQPAD